MSRVGSTHYVVSGSGPALVLIHGVGLNLAMWKPALSLLEPHFTVIRYDLIGHGATADAGPAVGLSDFVEQLRQLLDHLREKKPHVLGFSLGGIIARGWAAAFPPRIAKLVVLCSIAPRGAEARVAIGVRLAQLETSGVAATVDAAIDRWFTPGFIAARPAVIAGVRAMLDANQGPGYPAAYRFFATADDVIEDLGSVVCPTLAITAENDVGSTPEMAERIAAASAAGQVHIVPTLRHMAVVESPQAVLIPVMNFLRS